MMKQALSQYSVWTSETAEEREEMLRKRRERDRARRSTVITLK